MRNSAPEIEALLLQIHSAVLEPANWDRIAADICRLLDADRATLFAIPRDNRQYWRTAINFDPDALHDYATEHVAHDVWLQGTLQSGRNWTGVVTTGEQLIERRTFLNTPFFNDYLKRYDMDRFINVVLQGPPNPGLTPDVLLSVFRGLGREEFGSREMAILEHLSPHLTLAARNCIAAVSLLNAGNTLDLAVDSLSVAVLALAVDRHLCGANSAGEQLLREQLVARVIHGRIMPGTHLRNPATLEHVLDELKQGRSSSGMLELADSHERRLVFAAPLSSEHPASRFWMHQPHALLWIAHSAIETSTLERFSQVFLLTPAELRLLHQFVALEDLARASAVLNRSIHTARAQMKSILRKTGRRSQSQLLALVARYAAIRGDSTHA